MKVYIGSVEELLCHIDACVASPLLLCIVCQSRVKAAGEVTAQSYCRQAHPAQGRAAHQVLCSKLLHLLLDKEFHSLSSRVVHPMSVSSARITCPFMQTAMPPTASLSLLRQRQVLLKHSIKQMNGSPWCNSPTREWLAASCFSLCRLVDACTLVLS